MSVAVRVMAHDSRRRLAIPLAAYLDAEIVWDPKPTGVASAWRVARRAWRAPTERSHVLVVQDDAIPAPRFLARARALIREYPDVLLAFYLGNAHHSTRAYHIDTRNGVAMHELIAGHYVPTLALAMPARHAHDVARREPECAYDDEVIGRYRTEQGLRCLIPIPLLCDHNVHVPSIVWKDRDGYPADRHAATRPGA